jgi:hypothetical protein
MLAVKFIELEKSDKEANHNIAAESRNLLAVARSRSGPRADRAKKRKKLFKLFPELWKRAHEVDCRKPENGDGERPPKEVLNFETKKKISKADRKKIAPLVPGMPLRMGFMYKNVRPQIMHLLISLYGSQAFVNAFGNNAIDLRIRLEPDCSTSER